jgi:hypothetical protein
MKLRMVWSVLLCVAIGFSFAGIVSSSRAVAENAGPASVPRFQISAYAGPASGGVSHGAYVIDTITGKVWQVRAGGDPVKIAEKLP